MNIFKSEKITFVSSIGDVSALKLENNKKTPVMLVGDALLGDFLKSGAISQIESKLANNYYKQGGHSADGYFEAFSGKSSARFNVYMSKSIYEALKSKGIADKNIYFAFDSIVRYIKFSTLKKHGVVYCVSSLTDNWGAVTGLLIESFRYSKGQITGFK